MIEISIEGQAQLRDSFARLVPELQDQVLRGGAQAAFDSAQGGADAHTRTGALARSLRLRSINDGFEVFHDRQMAPHALFVHWGTRAHEIRPRRKKALRWVPAGGGVFAFARRVQHPGYEGDAWMLRARDAAIDTMQRLAERTL